jgi:type IV pilus assembly protein PilF
MTLVTRSARRPYRLPVAALALSAIVALAGCETVDQPATPVRDLRGPSAPSSPARSPAPRASDPSRDAPQTSSSQPSDSDPQRRAQIRLELGANYYQSRQYALAIEELRQSLSAEPNFAPAWGMLGLVYMDLGETARAEESFQRALKIAPDDSELLNNYGWFLCQTERPREAIPQFEAAVRTRSTPRPRVRCTMPASARCEAATKRPPSRSFQRSFQLDARNPVAMFHLSEIYLKRGDLERSRFLSQRLLSLYPASAETLWLAIRVDRRVGDRDSIASLSSQLRRQFPGSREAGLLQRGAFGD